MIEVLPEYWRISPDEIELVLTGLWLFSPTGEVQEPRLDLETSRRLTSCGLGEDDIELYWQREPSPLHQGSWFLTTVMKFKDRQKAMLYKLTWGGNV